MKLFRWSFLLVVSSCFLLLTSCREAKEGADELADEITGKKKIEKKIETEKKINDIVDKANKEQAEALKNLSE